MKIKKMTQIRRRDAMAIILGTTGAFIMSSSVYASKDKFTQRINKITNNKGAEETEIFLDVPEIAENGNQVKVNFEIESPMSQNDYIKTVYILADGNPSPDVAKFSFSPEMGVCSATTRMRLSKTQNVYLLAENNNNQFFMTKSMVKVTIGGCGG